MPVVQSVGPSKTIQGKYGELVVYSIQIDGEWVDLTQKPTTPAPTVGQHLEGTVETTQYGKRFKKAVNASGGYSNNSEIINRLDEILSILKGCASVSAPGLESATKPGQQPPTDDNQPPISNYDL